MVMLWCFSIADLSRTHTRQHIRSNRHLHECLHFLLCVDKRQSRICLHRLARGCAHCVELARCARTRRISRRQQRVNAVDVSSSCRISHNTAVVFRAGYLFGWQPPSFSSAPLFGPADLGHYIISTHHSTPQHNIPLHPPRLCHHPPSQCQTWPLHWRQNCCCRSCQLLAQHISKRA
jgi:hypothetical protein